MAGFDTVRDELDQAAEDLGLRAGGVRAAAAGGAEPWVLFGSAVLLLWGLRDTIGDVDVFAHRGLWDELEYRGWQRHTPDENDPPFLAKTIAGLDVHAFYDWTRKDPEVDARQCLRAAEAVHGWPCTPLQIIRMHKAMSLPKHVGSERHLKHARDVAAIDRLWAAEAA
jgi:hypothetical protein